MGRLRAGLLGFKRYFDLQESANLLSALWNPVPGRTNVLGAGQTVVHEVPPEPDVAFFRLLTGLR